MFYIIEKISDHPCTNLQVILEFFFKNTLNNGNNWISKQHKLLQKVNANSTLLNDLEMLDKRIQGKNELVKQTINQQFINNNKIEELCLGNIPLQNNIKWDEDIGKEIKTFFDNAYPDKLDLLIFKREGCTEKPTKKFYQDFIAKNGHICPFCSILPHKNPFGKKRGDFDHYLDKSHYPMAALNLDNLIPMCSECNQDYKHTSNILKMSSGKRRKFIYPYYVRDPFKLEITTTYESTRIKKWDFNIKISSNLNDKGLLTNFEDVFKINSRIKKELDKRYDSWIKEEVKRYIHNNQDISINEFKKYLIHIANNVINIEDRIIEGTLLKQAFFLFLGNVSDLEFDTIFLKSYFCGFDIDSNFFAS